MLNFKLVNGSIILTTFLVFLTTIWTNGQFAFVSADIQGMQESIECPGTCTTLVACKSKGGNVIGYCLDGKMCCGGGFNFMPTMGSCGSSVMSRKVAQFHSPNYPMYSSGSMICEFTLQLNPVTAGIRIDFLDLNLPTVPSNPVNFYESSNPVCDSDFMMIRGFVGWSPDFRCGNLTGYSLMVERENGQTILSTMFIMASMQYRWNIQFTEFYYNEVEALDYSLRTPTTSTNNINGYKKQWIWYPQHGAGISLQLSPPLGSLTPELPPSFFTPQPSWPYYHQPYVAKRQASIPEATAMTSEVEDLIATGGNDTVAVEYVEHFNNTSPSSRIVGGVDAQPNAIPWQVSLQLKEKSDSGLCGKNISSHFCGGSIIGDRTILTASHCFFSSSRYSHPLLPPSDIKVVVGEHDFCSDNEVSSTREYAIERIILHYNYLAADVINDLAVIHLVKPIKFDNNVYPIKLADEQTKMDILKPLISGWGSLGVETNSTYPSVLQQSSNVQIFSEQECQHFQREFLEYVYPTSKLSGKYRGAFDHGICTKALDSVTEAGFGDSGGPLSGIPSVTGTEGTPVLLGVVSHMRPHPDPKTNLEFHLNYFAKVAAYRKWIIMTMF